MLTLTTYYTSRLHSKTYLTDRPTASRVIRHGETAPPSHPQSPSLLLDRDGLTQLQPRVRRTEWELVKHGA